MERGSISITETGVVINPINGEVWLSAWEIATLFGVYPVKVSCNIRSILKSNVLIKEEVCCCCHYSNGNSVDLYNLEMIIALSFCIHSPKADRIQDMVDEAGCCKESKTADNDNCPQRHKPDKPQLK
jgi:hypothetical protein